MRASSAASSSSSRRAPASDDAGRPAACQPRVASWLTRRAARPSSASSAGTPRRAGSGGVPRAATWGSLVEEACPIRARGRAATGRPSSAAAPHPLAAVPRRRTRCVARPGIGELDRVLGGGLVQGSVILVGGDPGIGKSTLTLQACGALARQGLAVLYVAGEESPEQVRLRADRLGLGDAGVLILPETNVEAVDRADRAPSARRSSSSTRSRRCTRRRSRRRRAASARCASRRRCSSAHCKASGTACILIGHVTKEGALAGPRVLEHLVDTVLYFEGDGAHALRVLRAVKNRFGSTNEVGVFEMGERGLVEVAESVGRVPRRAARRRAGLGRARDARGQPARAGRDPGARVALGARHAAADGHRRSIPAASRCCSRSSRSAARMQLHDQDVFLNVAGGLRVDEPAADLAVVAAVASSVRGRPLPDDVVLWGEVGLTGEVRSVAPGRGARARGGAPGIPALRPAGRQRARPARPTRGLRVRGVGRRSTSSSRSWSSHDDRSSSSLNLGLVAVFVVAAAPAEPPRLRQGRQVVPHLALHRRHHADGRADVGLLRAGRGAPLHRQPGDLLHRLHVAPHAVALEPHGRDRADPRAQRRPRRRRLLVLVPRARAGGVVRRGRLDHGRLHPDRLHLDGERGHQRHGLPPAVGRRPSTRSSSRSSGASPASTSSASARTRASPSSSSSPRRSCS